MTIGTTPFLPLVVVDWTAVNVLALDEPPWCGAGFRRSCRHQSKNEGICHRSTGEQEGPSR